MNKNMNTDTDRDLVRAVRSVTIPQAARLTGYGVDTIRSWVLSGDLPATRPGGTGWYRIKLNDLVTFTGRDSLPRVTTR